MREILFRAKRIDDGEWVEGFLFSTNDHTYIAYPNQFDDDLFLSPNEIFIEVDPETVCQCTGLTDKNGRRIFKNDIVKLEDYHGHRTVYVFYGEDCGCWFYGGDGFSDEYIFNGQQKEVIGNYFDNEDLLGE